MDADKFLSMVKVLSPNTQDGATVALRDLMALYPEITIEEVAKVIRNMPGVALTDGKLGGIIIPAQYFEASK